MAATPLSKFFPFDVGLGIETEADWSEIARLWAGDGIAKTGVGSYDLNLLAPSGDGGGMYVKVASGHVYIKGHLGRLDAAATLAVPAAHATLGRLDRVVVRVNWATNVIELDVKAGTPNAVPLTGLAALVQSDGTVWEVEIARVTVAAAVSAISGGAVADLRPYLGPILPDGIVGTTQMAVGAASVPHTVSGVGIDTTAVLAIVPMAQMSVTFTPVVGAWHELHFHGEASHSAANGACRPFVYVDGSLYEVLPGFMSDSPNQSGPIGGHSVLPVLTAVPHTIEIRWALTIAGVGTVAAQRRMTVIEHRR